MGYLSGYFYAVPLSPGVIGRVTFGTYWKWLYVKPGEVPKYDAVALGLAPDSDNEQKRISLLNRFRDADTMSLGRGMSDAALHTMREQLYKLCS